MIHSNAPSRSTAPAAAGQARKRRSPLRLVQAAPHHRRWWASTACALAPLEGCALWSCALGPPRRGQDWMVAHPPPTCGRPCLAVRRPGPQWPRVWDQGGHHWPGAAVEVPPGPLRVRPPAGHPERRPPLHMALVYGATVAGGDRRADVAADPSWPGGALGPPRLLAPPPALPPHPLRGRDGRRQAPNRGGGLLGPLWDNDPARHPPPPPDPEPLATWREVATAVHTLLLGSPTSRGPPCRRRGRSRPLPGGHTSSAASTPAPTEPPGCLAEGWEHGRPPRLPAHPPPPPACRRRTAASSHAASPASRRAHLGPVTSADRLTAVQSGPPPPPLRASPSRPRPTAVESPPPPG